MDSVALFWADSANSAKNVPVQQEEGCWNSFSRGFHFFELNPPKKVKESTPAGFEPARAKPNRFLIYRLNHSATVSFSMYEVFIFY